jgi:hypothetical protein
MGAFDPPGTVEIPGLRPNLYGKFTINLGVYVPSMRRTQVAKDDWINDYNCNLRYRLGAPRGMVALRRDSHERLLGACDPELDTVRVVGGHGVEGEHEMPEPTSIS